MSRLVSLYPAPWRARYEEEFLAVLESRPPTLADRVDLVRGALDARLRPQIQGPVRIPDRFGALPSVGFALFWVAIALAVTGPVQHDAYGSYRDGAAAVPFLFAAFALLSVGLFRIASRLPPEAGRPALGGAVAMIAGPVWGMAPWLMPVGLVFLVGVVGLALGARGAGLMSTGSVVILGLAIAVPLALIAAASVLPWYALRTADVEPVVVILPLSLVWLVYGRTLLHGFVPAPAAT